MPTFIFLNDVSLLVKVFSYFVTLITFNIVSALSCQFASFFRTGKACIQELNGMTFPWATGDPVFNSLDLGDKNRHTESNRGLLCINLLFWLRWGQ